MTRTLPILVFAAFALCPTPLLAQDRPSEDELFGAPADGTAAPDDAEARPSEEELFGGGEQEPAETTADGKAAEAEARPSEDAMFGGEDPVRPDAPAPASREEALFGAGAEEKRANSFGVEDGDTFEDPLKIGGQLYLRVQQSAREKEPPSQWRLQAPALVDGYFDARPNDRVRGMLVGRLSFDPTIPSGGVNTGFGVQDGGPRVVLDQLWLRFDIERTVFVTAGRQHVRWGTGRFWMPGDFLHPIRRDPLAVFDARIGTTMVKLHVPWEATGWNFYGVAMLENTDAVDRIGSVAGAARVEAVLGPAELGIDAIAQRGARPRFGFDVSTGLGPIPVDVYAEVVVKKGHDGKLWRLAATPDASLGPAGLFEENRDFHAAFTPQATLGATWSFKYSDEDTATVGAEYFYNHVGYDDPKLYPWLIFNNQFTPFYLGKHYGALFAMLMAPGSWNDTTFTLSTLSNISDQSYISRLDYSLQMLTYLRLEAFGAVHYGTKGGEFRFGTNIPAQVAGGGSQPIIIPAPTFELGLGLRVNI